MAEKKVCAKCKSVDNSWADQFEDTAHRECDRCHINLCRYCDEGDYFYGDKIDEWIKRSGKHDELTEEDWTYRCKECLSLERAGK